jgi:hypothetical protein
LPVRFLVDANLDQDIVAGLLRREPQIDFELPQGIISEKMPDPDVLALAVSSGRVLVTHDVRTMPRHFGDFLDGHESPGLILVPKTLPIARVINDLLLIWQLSDERDWVNRFRRLPL